MSEKQFEEFLNAVRRGDVESANKLCRDDWIDKEDVGDKFKRTPMQFSCDNGHSAIVQLLLDRGCQIEEADENGLRPIHRACFKGYVALVQLLLDRGCQIEAEDRNGWRPIHKACFNGHAAVVQLLLERACQIEAADRDGWRAIHCACDNGHFEVVQLLLHGHCQIEAVDLDRWQPVHLASYKGYAEIVKLLLDSGCHTETENDDGWRPIHWACDKGHVTVVELLIDRKCQIEAEDRDGWRPIHWACFKGHFDLVQLLLKNRCNIEAVDLFKRRPIHWACNKGHVDIVKLLLDRGCQIETADGDGWRPIHWACFKGHYDVVKLLLDEGCEIEVETKERWRPIHRACFNGHVSIVQLLLDRGCQIETADGDGWRPIHRACFKGHADIVEILMNWGCVIDAKSYDLEAPMDFAKQWRKYDCASIIKRTQKIREKTEFQIFHLKKFSIVCRQFRIFDITSTVQTVQQFVHPLKRPMVFCHFIIDKSHFPPHLTVIPLVSEGLTYQEHIVVDNQDDMTTVKSMVSELRYWDLLFVNSSEDKIQFKINSMGDAKWIDRLLVNLNVCEEGSKRLEETVHIMVENTTTVADMKNIFIDFMKLLFSVNIRADNDIKLHVGVPEILIVDKSCGNKDSRLGLVVKFLTMRNRLLIFYDKNQQKLASKSLLKDVDLGKQRCVLVQQKRLQSIKLIHSAEDVIDDFVYEDSLLIRSVTDDRPSIVLLRKYYQNAGDIRKAVLDKFGKDDKIVFISGTDVIYDNTNIEDLAEYVIVERYENANVQEMNNGFLGGGAYGEVFKCKLPGDEKTFAMKEIKDFRKDGNEMQTDIKTEILVAARVCGHERIMKYRGFYEKILGRTPHFYILMDCMKESLSKYVERSKPLEEEKIIQLSKEILQGLKYLHDCKIIHRDIKGANVLLDENESVKLTDFGVSKCLNNDTVKAGKEGAATNTGTINYRAPETILKEGQKQKPNYGMTSDIWSFGATMVEMVTGLPPFDGMNYGQIFNVLSNSQNMPYEFPSIFSSALNDFMNLCLKPDPKERPNSTKLLANKIFRTSHSVEENNFDDDSSFLS